MPATTAPTLAPGSCHTSRSGAAIMPWTLDGRFGDERARYVIGRAGRAFGTCVMVAAVPCVLFAQEIGAAAGGGAAASTRRQLVWRDSMTAFVYTRPTPLRAITGIPMTLGVTARETVQGRHLPVILGVAVSTVALVAADEQVLHESRRLAQHVGLPPNHPSADVRLGAFKMAFPTTIGSGLYFLGRWPNERSDLGRVCGPRDAGQRHAGEADGERGDRSATRIGLGVAGAQARGRTTDPIGSNRTAWPVATVRESPRLQRKRSRLRRVSVGPSHNNNGRVHRDCRELPRAPVHLACRRDHDGHAGVHNGEQRRALGERLPARARARGRGRESRRAARAGGRANVGRETEGESERAGRVRADAGRGRRWYASELVGGVNPATPGKASRSAIVNAG